uniref:CSON004774 protein n=1 Tax=Culicoides sonorensis TaxID=179676 RepID=A0A336MPG3_CULSO
MVYETDFYTTRRPYSRPTISSYSVTSTNERTSSSSSSNPYSSYSRPTTTNTYSSTTERRSTGGPGGYSYSSDRTSSYGGPGGYSYSSTTTGTLPYGTKYRHYSYLIPGVGRVYSPNLYNYSTYVSGYTPALRHYTPISSYSYHLPTYSYDYSLPGSLYLPSAVPIRYYSRSSPVRVVTSPLRDYSPPRIFSVNVRPSVIHRELMRIEHKTRPRYGYDPTEEYLNTTASKEFEDDLRHIRTQTSRVLSRIHAPLPRARRAISCTPFSSLSDREYFDHIYAKPSVRDDIFTMANYSDPLRHYSGKSHLASVRICGNKGYPVRKPAYTDDIYDPAKVHNEVQYLSYYLKNRRAAAENENRAPKLESGQDKVLFIFHNIHFILFYYISNSFEI